MNQITLIGQLAFPPTYHCTHQGQDLTRFEIRTAATEGGKPEAHHCTAWGPAALDLHRHLNPGDRLLVRGELRYRSRTLRQGGTLRVPVIYVRGYSYLGRSSDFVRGNPEGESLCDQYKPDHFTKNDEP